MKLEKLSRQKHLDQHFEIWMRIRSKTRLHSSRMRTARALTISPSILCAVGGVPGLGGGVPGLGGGGVLGPRGGCTWSWGVYLVPWGVPGPGGVVPGSRGVYLVPGGFTWSRWGDVPGPSGGCTWSRGVYLVRHPPRGQNHRRL